jgi:hypothetical protein
MFPKVFLVVVLAACVAVAAVGAPQERNDTKPVTSEEVKSSEPGEAIVRGEKIGDSPVVSLADVMKQPEKYQDKTIILEGTVDGVCQKKGCWMELVPAPGEAGVRVTFKNYGFFVPKDAKGFKVRAEGKLKFTTLSKEDADHYEEEGARLVRNADGTVKEIGFVASGVELYRAPEKE